MKNFHKKILIVPTKKAYLPDIYIYKKLFRKFNLAVEIIEKPDKTILKDFNVIWRFMGIDANSMERNDQLLIHEYQSSSVKPLPRFKNKIKKFINTKPDIRIFQNKIVMGSFKFNDNIKTFFRPMGVSKDFLLDKPGNKYHYDFLYVGTLNKRPKTLKDLMNIGKLLPNKKILLIGDIDEKIKTKLLKYSANFYFKGFVEYSELPHLYRKCEYGLNLIPNEYPYNQQDSTKLIEYSAAGMKIISSDNHIARTFQKNFSVPIVFFNEFNIHTINKINSLDKKKYELVKENISELTWDKIIYNLLIRDGLLEIINKS